MPTYFGDEEPMNDKSLYLMDVRYVNQSGDKLQGYLDMNNNRIMNLPSIPIGKKDAVNKEYIETSVPMIHGFRLTKTVTTTDNVSRVTVQATAQHNPNQIMLILTPVSFLKSCNRSFTESTGERTLVTYSIKFVHPVGKESYFATIEGSILLLPNEVRQLNSTDNQVILSQ